MRIARIIYLILSIIQAICLLRILLSITIVWIRLYHIPKGSQYINNITYIDTIRKRACIPDTDTKRVVYRDGSTGVRLDHINMLYKASSYNKDIVMVAYKEAFRSPRYSLTIRGTRWERGMCQVLPFWFRRYPEIFNDKYLTDVNAQIQWCLRLRHRAYEWNNFYQTRSTFRNRMEALRYIEFID